MSRPTARWSLVLAAALLASCVSAPPQPLSTRQPAKPRASTAARAADPVGIARPSLAGQAVRAIAQDAGAAVQLTGKTKLISDHGVGIISNNTGGLVSNNGGGIIANNGGGIIANNGGAMVSKAKYALRQAAEEALLAEAFVEVLDGQGRVLVDEAGVPIGAFTDAAGAFTIDAPLPAENLVLRVRLFPNGGAKAAGGELLAIVPKGATGAQDLDTASSLGAAYVLEKFVQKRPGVFDKLPASEADALRREARAAIVQLPPGPPTYAVADQVAAADALAAKAKGLADTFERIRAILVAGASIRAGARATEVALAGPMGIVGDAAGNVYVAEYTGGRIRVLRPDGTMALFAGGVSTTGGKDGDEALKVGFESPHGLAIGPDGHLYVADSLRNQVRRLETGADGVTRVRLVAGDGNRVQGALGMAAAATSVQQPTSVAFGPDGRLYIGENTKSQAPGRILAVDADGTLRAIALPADWGNGQVASLAFGPDEALWVVDGNGDQLRRRTKDGAWSVVLRDRGLNDFSKVVVAPDGAAYVSLDKAAAVVRIAADGTRTPLAGTGTAGFAGDGGPAAQAQVSIPASLWLAPGNELWLSDYGNTVVRAVGLDDPSHPIRTVAGTLALTRRGDALALPISNPAGLAVDPQGRLVVAETTSHTLRRLEGDRLTVFAGTELGFAGDGGPAAAARFDTPGGLFYHGADLYVVDATNRRIRKIAADGMITTVVGDGNTRKFQDRVFPALGPVLNRAFSVAVGPDGRLYWSDNDSSQILRLRADGMAEVVAGALDQRPGDEGDGGLAADAVLGNPTAIAFGPDGALYFVDATNLKIRKLTGLTGDAPRIEAVAGLGMGGSLAALSTMDGNPPLEEALAEATLIGPVSLAVTATGDVLVGELGASKLQTLAGMSGAALLTLPPIGSRIRKITGLGGPNPRIRTVAGHGGPTLNDPASDDSLNAPFGLLIDAEGRLVIADSNNNQIKLLPKGAF